MQFVVLKVSWELQLDELHKCAAALGNILGWASDFIMHCSTGEGGTLLLLEGTRPARQASTDADAWWIALEAVAEELMRSQRESDCYKVLLQLGHRGTWYLFPHSAFKEPDNEPPWRFRWFPMSPSQPKLQPEGDTASLISLRVESSRWDTDKKVSTRSLLMLCIR